MVDFNILSQESLCNQGINVVRVSAPYPSLAMKRVPEVTGAPDSSSQFETSQVLCIEP